MRIGSLGTITAAHALLLLCCHNCLLADPDSDPTGLGAVTSYKRGLSPCVFVPWEGVASSPLNLAVKDMDFWMPG